MNKYLVIKLQGVMQAWGGHTYEDLRHSELVPTRSGVLGLLAACIGIDRGDVDNLKLLSASVRLAVRIDKTKHKPTRIMDFHTVLDARKVDGKPNKNPVVSRREYLCDAAYTVLIQEKTDVSFTIDTLSQAIQQPSYTPFLGRRSCLVSRPLFEEIITAIDLNHAFNLIEPIGGVIYSEEKLDGNDAIWRMRDEPVYARKRQFASRSLYIHNPSLED